MSELGRAGLLGGDGDCDERVGPDNADGGLDVEEVGPGGLDLSGGWATLKGAGRLEGF